MRALSCDSSGEHTLTNTLMTVWQRQASAAWVAANESLLEIIAGTRLAIIQRPDHARRLVQVICQRRADAEKLQHDFGGGIASLPDGRFQISSSRTSIRVGRRLEIVSEPTPGIEKRSQLIIPAADAFGTGEHSTTAMSLRLLEETTRKFSPGGRLLDAGTGTGILALAARRLGAAEALGLDNDPRAIATARRNARLNRIGRVKFMVGDILRFKPVARYEIVTANLFSELLIAALPKFRQALRPRGSIILSGILREQAPDVIAALPRVGFEVKTKRCRGKWVALACRRFALRSAEEDTA